MGQYLAPLPRHLAVDRFPEPEAFSKWDQVARDLGFKAVACGPLVRSSYRAGLLVEEAKGGPVTLTYGCLLYTSPSPRDATLSRMPSSA